MQKFFRVGIAAIAILLLGNKVSDAVRGGGDDDLQVLLDRADRAGYRRAALVSPHSAAPWIALGLLDESEGNRDAAVREFQDALALDRGYLPRWTLANFYLRQGNAAAWPLVKEALRIALHGGQDPSALFETCWQFRPNARFLLQEVVGEKAEILRLYVPFLIASGRVEALAEPALALARAGERKDDALLLRASDRLLGAGDTANARQIWDRIVGENASGELLTNTALRTPRQLGFDWRFNSLPECAIRFEGAAQIEFSGRQPNPLELLFETVPVREGNYQMTWEAKSDDPLGEPGMFWQATDDRTGALLLRSPVRALPGWTAQASRLAIGSGTKAVRLSLRAERVSGQARFQGTVWLRRPSLRAS